MEAFLPLALALVLFPLALVVPRLRQHRHGYLFPLALSVILLATYAVQGAPAMLTYFAMVGAGIAWRWRPRDGAAGVALRG